MEGILIILGGAIVLAPIVALILSIIAFGRVSSLRREVESLKDQLAERTDEPVSREDEEPKSEPEAVQQSEPEPAGPSPGEESGGGDTGEEVIPESETADVTVDRSTSTLYSSDGESESSPGWLEQRLSGIDWENFTGMKLFAWLGGFMFFLGLVFFFQYVYQQGWINPSPVTKVIGGMLLGLGLIVWSLWIEKDQYRITMHTLAAMGVAGLYADAYAAHAYYDLISLPVSFGFMALVTVTALCLADRLRSVYVAVLGWLGGFITPVLLSTGADRPYFYFGYLALLNLGLIILALRREWGFLVSLGAVATFLSELGWYEQYFTVDKGWIGFGVFVLFAYLFAGARRLADRFWETQPGRFLRVPAGFMPIASMGFVLLMMEGTELAYRPGIVLSLLLLLDLAPAYLAWRSPEETHFHLLAGVVSFLILFTWTGNYLNQGLVTWALPYYLAFGILHGGMPVLLSRLYPDDVSGRWAHFFPPAVLALMFCPVLLDIAVSFLVWPFVLLGVGLAMAVAWILGSAGFLVVNLLLVMVGIGSLIFQPAPGMTLIEFIVLITLFSLVFFVAGLLFLATDRSDEGESLGPLDELAEHLPAVSAVLPFVLVVLMIAEINLSSGLPVFGLTGLMVVLLHGLIRYQRIDVLSLIATGSVVVIEYTWHFNEFYIDQPWPSFGWYVLFHVFFFLFPFVFHEELTDRYLPWVSSAAIGLAHTPLYYNLFVRSHGDAYIGLLPAGLAVIMLGGLYFIVTRFTGGDELRERLMALFGGVALFFITLVFPLQLEKQWLTISWALEGVALLWLYRRVSHEGLRLWAGALLTVSFVRLTFNPAVFSYHSVSHMPILNWYLYTYGIVTACLFVAGRWIDQPPEHWVRTQGRRWFPVMGTVLAFLLLNIEIADYFSGGSSTITFEFSASLAQNMTYSLAWALFALAVMAAGIIKKNKWARRGSLGLFIVTIVKVFLHDLWYLGQLYRVGSLIGLSVVLILVSFAYQKYLSGEDEAVET